MEQHVDFGRMGVFPLNHRMRFSNLVRVVAISSFDRMPQHVHFDASAGNSIIIRNISQNICISCVEMCCLAMSCMNNSSGSLQICADVELPPACDGFFTQNGSVTSPMTNCAEIVGFMNNSSEFVGIEGCIRVLCLCVGEVAVDVGGAVTGIGGGFHV
jgi:hypothetical protein